MKVGEILKNKKRLIEIFLYLVFGVLTTLVDFATYWILTDVIGYENYDAAHFISQFTAMVFAFVTNKLLVFKNSAESGIVLAKQIVSFFFFRFLTIGFNSLMFFIFHTVIGINDYIVKAAVSVIVVILNYVVSKFFVFVKQRGADK